jgi:hypothetical protein
MFHYNGLIVGGFDELEHLGKYDKLDLPDYKYELDKE